MVYHEICLLIPDAEIPPVLNEACPGDTLDAGALAVLADAGLSGTVEVVDTPVSVGSGYTRVSLAQRGCPPGVWVPRRVVLAALSVPVTATGGVVSAVLPVAGAVVGAPVVVACGEVSAALAATVQGAPWAWISAADTVTVAVRVGALLAGATLPLYLYLLPEPP